MASFARIGEEPGLASAPVPLQEQDWAERLEKAIERGANHLLSLQAEQGYWQGELEADSTLESDYIYYLHVLGKADPERIAKLANYVRQRQQPDGVPAHQPLERDQVVFDGLNKGWTSPEAGR